MRTAADPPRPLPDAAPRASARLTTSFRRTGAAGHCRSPSCAGRFRCGPSLERRRAAAGRRFITCAGCLAGCRALADNRLSALHPILGTPVIFTSRAVTTTAAAALYRRASHSFSASAQRLKDEIAAAIGSLPTCRQGDRRPSAERLGCSTRPAPRLRKTFRAHRSRASRPRSNKEPARSASSATPTTRRSSRRNSRTIRICRSSAPRRWPLMLARACRSARG